MLIKPKRIVVVIDISLVKSLVNLLVKVSDDDCEKIIGTCIELVLEKGRGYTVAYRYTTSRNDIGMFGSILDSVIDEIYHRVYSDIINLTPNSLAYYNSYVNVRGKVAEIHIENGEEIQNAN